MGHELGKNQILNTDYIPLQSFMELNPFKWKLFLMIFKHSVCTSKKTQPITIPKINQLVSFREITTVY
jgi:hypothetical protein